MTSWIFTLMLVVGIAAPAGPSAEGLHQERCIRFTLANRGLKSIPLRIPGVMNPNLSPMSNSGVCLALGQEILFNEKGKRQVILTVTADLQDSVLVVNRLLQEKIPVKQDNRRQKLVPVEQAPR